MALTTDEQELLDFALASLPSWFSSPERDFAIEGGMAKQMGAARAQSAYWFAQTLIGGATGATSDTPDWLNQHAKDRGTRRQASESDAALRIRLRQYPDALTRELLLSIIQDMLTDAGVAGAPAMVELRRDRAHLTTNEPQSGTGVSFSPSLAYPGKRRLAIYPPGTADNWAAPPLFGQGTVHLSEIVHKIVISGALSAGNDGTFVIEALEGNCAVITNAAYVGEPDPGASWRVDRYDRDGNLMTGGSGRADAYCDRGYRCGSTYPTILLILPYGTSAALAASVLETVRQRKAAGVRVIVERRQSP
jgi:hypothetical protein